MKEFLSKFKEKPYPDTNKNLTGEESLEEIEQKYKQTMNLLNEIHKHNLRAIDYQARLRKFFLISIIVSIWVLTVFSIVKTL